MGKFMSLILGAALVAAGVLLEPFTGGLSTFLIMAGAGMAINGIGTLLTKGSLATGSTAARSAVAPWNVVYGRTRVGGTLIYFNEFVPPAGSGFWSILSFGLLPNISDYFLDMVFVVACHQCQGIEALLFDGQRIQLSTNKGAFNGIVGDSFTPVQQNVNITHISRTNNVVTAILAQDIPLLQVGDNVTIQNISGDYSLNGTFPVESIITQVYAPGTPGSLTFTYLCGGLPAIVDNEGQCLTLWPDYGPKVHMEVLLGNHTATFPGMLSGTPVDGDPGNIVNYADAPYNPWSAACVCQGRTVVFLRLHYSDKYFASGIPTVSFIVQGKNNIYDPRTSTTQSVLHVMPWTLIDGVATQRATGVSDYSYLVVPQPPGVGPNSTLGVTTDSDNILSQNNYNALTWDAVDGATSYDVYRTLGWLTGKIANTANIWFNDTGFVPLNSLVPSGGSYSANPALCIADYLADVTFGFKALYGTEVPLPQLIAAANHCDETIDLANGSTEPRYALDGTFPLSMKRGEVLQNLLTSCGGRLTFAEGQFVIQPAGWSGVAFELGAPSGLPAQIASAVLSMVTSYTPGSYDAFAAVYVGAIGLFAFSAPALFDESTWVQRTDTVPLGGDAIAATQNGSLHVQFTIVGTLFGDSTPECEFLVFDTWIDVVFVDGTTARWVPYSVSTVAGSTGDIQNQQNAQDGDPTTYATVERGHFSSLGSGSALQLGGYAAVPAPTPPDLSQTGVVATGEALAHAAGPFRWRPNVSSRDLYNGCKGTFISPGNKWQSSDFPPYAQDTKHGYASGSPLDPWGDANLAADGGDRRWLDIQLPFTISVSMAQRLAKIELLRRRQQGTGTFIYDMALYQAIVLDIIQMTLPMLGWKNKLLEIAAFRFALDKANSGKNEVTLLGTQLDVQETDPSVYAWHTSEELSPAGYQQAKMPTNTGITGTGTLGDVYTVNGT
jgi:hypothetical protein